MGIYQVVSEPLSRLFVFYYFGRHSSSCVFQVSSNITGFIKERLSSRVAWFLISCCLGTLFSVVFDCLAD